MGPDPRPPTPTPFRPDSFLTRLPSYGSRDLRTVRVTLDSRVWVLHTGPSESYVTVLNTKFLLVVLTTRALLLVFEEKGHEL